MSKKSPYTTSMTPSRSRKDTRSKQGGILLSEYLLEPNKYISSPIQQRPGNTPQSASGRKKPDYLKQNNNIVEQVQSLRYTPNKVRYVASPPRPNKIETSNNIKVKKRLNNNFINNTIDHGEKYFNNMCDPEYEEKPQVFKINLGSINLMKI